MCHQNAFPHPLKACDGKDDPISFGQIEKNKGYCMNGRCYSIDTLYNLHKNNSTRDPWTRKKYSPAHLEILELMSILDDPTNGKSGMSLVDSYVDSIFALGQYYAVLRHGAEEMKVIKDKIELHKKNAKDARHKIESFSEQTPDLSDGHLTRDDVDELVNRIHVYHVERRINEIERILETYNFFAIVQLSPTAQEEVKKFYNGYLKWTRKNVNALRIPDMSGYNELIAYASN